MGSSCIGACDQEMLIKLIGPLLKRGAQGKRGAGVPERQRCEPLNKCPQCAADKKTSVRLLIVRRLPLNCCRRCLHTCNHSSGRRRDRVLIVPGFGRQKRCLVGASGRWQKQRSSFCMRPAANQVRPEHAVCRRSRTQCVLIAGDYLGSEVCLASPSNGDDMKRAVTRYDGPVNYDPRECAARTPAVIILPGLGVWIARTLVPEVLFIPSRFGNDAYAWNQTASGLVPNPVVGAGTACIRHIARYIVPRIL